ncbi:MAG: urease accessory UreF family protein [Pseudomonadota bacterium]
MTDPVVTLATWLSPGFPVGAFAYSHGLETATAERTVRDVATTEAWIGDVLVSGGGRTDAILLAASHRAASAGEPVDGIAELAAALAPSAERRLETEAQGAAFAETVGAVWGLSAGAAPYPVAYGRAAAEIGAPLGVAAALFLNAFAANLVSAAVRLVPLGQTEGQRIVAWLHPVAEALAAEAAAADLDDIGGSAILADAASMRHETQPVRLFRS